MSAANKVTIGRILVLPLLIMLLAHTGETERWGALVLFLVASATDWLDGYLARARGQVTKMGKLLDPVADKLLITATLLPLVHRELVADWMAVLLLGREFLVSGLRSVASSEGVVIPAGRLGKWKMGASIAALSFLIVTPPPPASGAPWQLPGTVLLWVTLGLSLGSAAQYFYTYRHALRSHAEPAAP